MLQSAEDEIQKFSIASKIVETRLYVDNLVAGANSIKDTISARDNLIGLLAEGGFILRQWVSNNPRITEPLPEELNIRNESHITQTLGVYWDTETDESVFYLTNEILNDEDVTKQSMLSDIMSLLHDRMGLTVTVKIKFKIMMRELYCLEMGWDVCVPESIAQPYINMKN